MKNICTFGVTVAASVALLQSAEGGSRGSARSFASAPHFSPAVSHFSGPSRSYSGNGARFNSAARFSQGATFHNRSYVPTGPRFSGATALRNPTYSPNRTRFAGNRTTAFNSANLAAGRTRFAANQTAGIRSQGFNRERVVARHSPNWNRNWDRRRDHFWNGRRCHFRNNVWVIYEPFFFSPYAYGYGYYPYGSYYDNAAYSYDDRYAQNEYSADTDYSQPAEESGSRVSNVQSALAREGYYDGPIDGSLGPATQKALRRYQRDHGLQVTGSVSRGVLEALRLR
jgi:hypothetical protein